MSSYKDLQTKIFERDNYTCQYCGKSSREYRALVMAHIRTASLCGDDRESNLITLCRHCYDEKCAYIKTREVKPLYEKSICTAEDLATGKRSVMCPRCGKLLTWVNKNDKKHHKVMCTHCRKWIWFWAGTQEFQIKEVPQRTSASGMRFY